MKISVVIPTFERKNILAKTLDALKNQKVSGSDWDIWVVNDGSLDGTKEFMEALARTWTKLHFIDQKNQGASAARNRALKDANFSADIILFLGDDIIPQTDSFLQEHVDFHVQCTEPQQLALGFSPWHPDLESNDWMNYLMKSGDQFGQKRHVLLKMLSSKKTINYFDFWHFYTSNVSLKSTLLQGELFNESFLGWGWEDIELAYRLQKKYGKELELYLVEKALAYHDHSMYPDEAEKRRVSSYKNAKIFESIHPELQVIPRGLKKWIFSLVSHPYSPWSLGLFGSFWRFYAQQKRTNE